MTGYSTIINMMLSEEILSFNTPRFCKIEEGLSLDFNRILDYPIAIKDDWFIGIKFINVSRIKMIFN